MYCHELNLILFFSQVALLNPIENPQLELAIVMLIVPFFVNVSATHFMRCLLGYPSAMCSLINISP